MIELSWPTLLLSTIVAIWCVKIFYRFRRRILSPSFEVGITNTMAGVDNADLNEEEEVGELFFDPKMCKTRFRSKVVLCAKAEFGLINRTEANRMMVRKFLRDKMRSHGLRPSHIAAHVDICVALFFIPSRSDIYAAKVNASYEAVTRDECVGNAWISAYTYFGKMLGFQSE